MAQWGWNEKPGYNWKKRSKATTMGIASGLVEIEAFHHLRCQTCGELANVFVAFNLINAVGAIAYCIDHADIEPMLEAQRRVFKPGESSERSKAK